MVDKLESLSAKTGTNYSHRSASWQRKVSADFAACRRSAYHNPSGRRVKGRQLRRWWRRGWYTRWHVPIESQRDRHRRYEWWQHRASST